MIGRRQIQAMKHAIRDDIEIARVRKYTPEEKEPGPPVVYFLQAAGVPESPIKIGFSAVNTLEDRLLTLQIGNPHRLRILATMPGGQDVEHRLHTSFAHAHVRGEWFEPTPALLALIDGLPNCVRLDTSEAAV